MTIRKAQIKDVEAVHNLAKAKELLTASGEPSPKSYFRDLINEDRSVFLVAEKNQEVIGYSLADLLPGKVAIWWFLAVNPNHQDEGIGKKLTQKT